jgi:polyribonucleotide nucleotidyltransferase
MTNGHVRVEAEVHGLRLTLETGQMARQAGGSVIATLGDTKVFAAVTSGHAREDIDFFPLVCDYREKTESAGKIPGGFFKREGRPTTKEILTMRLTDRSIRPMFPDGYKQEVQVMAHVLQYDGVQNPDVLAMIASFAAIRISGLPFAASLGAVRIGHVDDELVVFPTDEQRRDSSRLDLVVSGHKDGLAMVESSAKELAESDMIDALELANDVIQEVVALVDELRAKAGKPEEEFVAPAIDEELKARVFGYEDELAQATRTQGKHERGAACDAVKNKCVEELSAGVDEAQLKARVKDIKGFFSELKRKVERAAILSGSRVDGRAWDEIRDITIVPNFVPRQHGSSLFTRGETQALVSCTLGTPDDEQIIDGVEKEYRKYFYLHYNFPPYSVGETRRIMGPGRREIGHGMLAERALQAVLPPKEGFPYTIRVVSDIMESNGSSSMASVCGGCLSMMLAGVPLTQPVAGIAMGLVQDGADVAILSDILGSEDHNGDMDFKVAGSGVGITALQMDIKIKGVTRKLLSRALEQARAGRIHILREMLEAVPGPSPEISEFAPRMETLKIPGEKIGFLIGPGGKNIKALQAEYEVRISILDDNGNVQVFGNDSARVKACKDAILASCQDPEVGSRHTGVVRSVRDFGAFIEILPGVEGLCHISELAEGYVGAVTDVVNVGDEIEVEIIAVDDRGKVKVSHRATLPGASERPADDRGPRGDRGDRGDRGGRGGDRGGRGRGDDRPRGRGRDDERPRAPRDDDRPRAPREDDRPRAREREDDRPRAPREDDRPRAPREDDDRPRAARDDDDRGGDRPRGRRRRNPSGARD